MKNISKFFWGFNEVGSFFSICKHSTRQFFFININILIRFLVNIENSQPSFYLYVSHLLFIFLACVTRMKWTTHLIKNTKIQLLNLNIFNSQIFDAKNQNRRILFYRFMQFFVLNVNQLYILLLPNIVKYSFLFSILMKSMPTDDIWHIFTYFVSKKNRKWAQIMKIIYNHFLLKSKIAGYALLLFLLLCTEANCFLLQSSVKRTRKITDFRYNTEMTRSRQKLCGRNAAHRRKLLTIKWTQRRNI